MSNSRCHVEDYYKHLLHHLQENGRDVVALSQRFSALETNADRVDFVYGLLEEFRMFPALEEDLKSTSRAERCRREGNDLYRKKEVFRAIEAYTKGLCCASEGSEEIALGYANRSAALFEKGFYQECLVDITRALDCNNIPTTSKVKLLARRAKAILLKPTQVIQTHHQPSPEIPTDKQNECIQCATNSIQLQCSEDLGRHVVAVKNIEIGEMIAVEKPFCFVLTNDYLTHCHECLKLCYNLLPCKTCTEALYCSENCAVTAQKYHKHECKVLKTIRSLNFDTMKLLPMKIALITQPLYQQIQHSNLDHTDETYRSDRYNEIHNLVANTKQRKVADLFKRSISAAVLFHLMKTHGDFFGNKTDEIAFKELVLLHMQTAPCNFHSITEIRKNNEGIYESDDIAAGAFSFLSMFNHSCNPNVVRQSFGPVLVLRAIRSIQAGEQLFDNYGYHYAVMSKEERQSDLKKQYFFECSCEACRDDWPLFEKLQCVTNDDNPCLDDLMKGDLFSAQKVLPVILPKMKELERVQPNKNFAEKQEVIKQCFALLGNLKRNN